MAVHTSTPTYTKVRVPVGIRESFEFTLPSRFKKKVTPGDFFRAELVDSEVVLRPVDAIDPEQTWFWTKQWQIQEQEADADIRMGRISGPFCTVRDFMRGLN